MKYLLCAILLSIIAGGCKKDNDFVFDSEMEQMRCQFLPLPAPVTPPGYSISVSAAYNTYSRLYQMNLDEVFIINDDSTYKATYGYWGDSIPFGEIDFSQKCIIGINIQTEWAKSCISRGLLYRKNNTDTFHYYIQYSLKNQCSGSGITNINFSANIIADKLPQGAELMVEVDDINPFY